MMQIRLGRLREGVEGDGLFFSLTWDGLISYAQVSHTSRINCLLL